MRAGTRVRSAVVRKRPKKAPKMSKTIVKKGPSPTKYAGSKPKSKKPKANVYTSRRK